MKFSVAWLREWVDPPVGVQGLADQLTMAGLEVDEVAPVAGEFAGVVVGHVVEREQHPNADKLSLCTVDVNDGEPVKIICGAANVAAGQKVAVARIGAVLPGNFKIKRAKLRGVESHGMICSASELGLAESSSGILELPLDAPIGEDFRHYLQLDDHTIEVDLTPDRGDCLGVAGIAREVGVINRTPLTPVAVPDVSPVLDEQFPVALEAPAACPRYLGRVVRGIDPAAVTPLWMQERLRRSGLRPVNPVADITNYVMLELGQPMHGFDLASLEGGIRVRNARPGEGITLLDGTQVTLREDTLVIADHARPLAIAGIMGGEGSGVTDTTRDVLFESAFFAPTAIIGKARSYGLHTDSSHRFERGVDPQLQRLAMERATRLLLDIAGGQAGPIVEEVSEADLPRADWIALRQERVAKLLGVSIADDEIEEILSRLGMEIERADTGWRVRAPSSRFDITIEADLIEEIGRIYGYTEIPATHGAVATVMRGEREEAFDLHRAKLVLVDRDYQEAVTYSFVAPELQQCIDPDRAGVRLANPISADMAVMRTSLWPGLLQALKHNQARQQERIRLFESGLRFVQGAEGLEQAPMLAAVVTGSVWAEQWGDGARQVDFFDIKGDLEALLELTGDRAAFDFVAESHPALHPGQSARILKGGKEIGWIGMLHPGLEKKFELTAPCYLFELCLGEALNGRLPAFSPLSKFPSMRRDIAIVLDDSVPIEKVLKCVRDHAPDFLRDIVVFDVYNGEKVEAGTRSLALGLIFQGTEGNLTDEEVEGAVAAALRALATELQARLRG